MGIEKGLHPINYVMKFVKSGEEFSLEDVLRMSKIEDESVLNSVLLNLSREGYVRFDCNSGKYVPDRKVKYLKNFR